MPQKGVAGVPVRTQIVAADVPDITLIVGIRIKGCLPFADLWRIKSAGLKSHEPVFHLVRETSLIWQAAIPSHNAYAVLREKRVGDGRCTTVRLKKSRNRL